MEMHKFLRLLVDVKDGHCADPLLYDVHKVSFALALDHHVGVGLVQGHDGRRAQVVDDETVFFRHRLNVD